MPRRPACIAVGVGIGQHFVELAELVLIIALGLLHALSGGGGGEEEGGKKQNETQGRLSGTNGVAGERAQIAGARKRLWWVLRQIAGLMVLRPARRYRCAP